MNNSIEIRVPLNNEQIKLKRKVALQIKNSYGLKFHPLVVDVISTTHLSSDAVRVVAKMTESNGKLCRCCNRTLKQDISMLVGVGSTCAKYMGLNYITDPKDVESFKEEIDKKVQEIGTFEFWIPKTQIREYVKGNRLKFLAEKFYK
jgi:hypothetical protein